MTEHRHTEHPICPYCGHADTDAWEWNSDKAEVTDDMQCVSCDRIFIATRNVTYWYNTREGV